MYETLEWNKLHNDLDKLSKDHFAQDDTVDEIIEVIKNSELFENWSDIFGELDVLENIINKLKEECSRYEKELEESGKRYKQALSQYSDQVSLLEEELSKTQSELNKYQNDLY